MVHILLVEDDLTFAKIVTVFLGKNGYHVDVEHTVKAALKTFSENTYQLLLLDYRLPDGTGLDLLEVAGKASPAIPIIMMTSFNDVRTAVKAMRSGVFEYIIKPLNPDELLMVIKEALAKKTEKNTSPSKKIMPSFIAGKSKPAKKLAEHIELVAPTEMSVLIIGESGTGKEYVARSIHDLSNRKNKSFVAIDCGTLSKELAGSELFGHVKGAFTGATTDKPGIFVTANGGTVFLDEIGNLGYDVQIKLLRMLQERSIQPVGGTKLIDIDIRLITATNENLVAGISKGEFREDIYHRINEFKIQVPPLREREEDLALFVDYFIKAANNELGKAITKLTDEAMEVFVAHDWPGNLRELRNVIKRMVLLSKTTIAGKESLPDEMIETVHPAEKNNTSDLKAMQEASEKEQISKVLQETKYNKSKAAKMLNIDRKTLYYKMEQYGID